MTPELAFTGGRTGGRGKGFYRSDNGILVISFLISFFFHLVIVFLFPTMNLAPAKKKIYDKIVVELVPRTPLKTVRAIEKKSPVEKLTPRKTTEKPLVRKRTVPVKKTPVQRVTRKKHTKAIAKKVRPAHPQPTIVVPTREEIMKSMMQEIEKSSSMDDIVKPRNHYVPKKKRPFLLPGPNAKKIIPDRKIVSDRGYKRVSEPKKIPKSFAESFQQDRPLTVPDVQQPQTSSRITSDISPKPLTAKKSPSNVFGDIRVNENLKKENDISFNRNYRLFTGNTSQVEQGKYTRTGVLSSVSTGNPTMSQKSFQSSQSLKKTSTRHDRKVIYDPPKPEMPNWVKEKGINPSVRIKIHIEKNGRVNNVKFIQRSGYPRLDELVSNYMMKRLYEPAGHSDYYTVRFDFTQIK